MSGNRHEEAKRWLLQSRYDLKAARWNIEGGFFDTACFLSQQAAEKALKSVLYYSGADRKRMLSHSTFDLASAAGNKVKELKTLLKEARSLDLHYIPSRYPDGLPSSYPHRFYSKETAIETLEMAGKITEVVENYYSSEGFEVEAEEE